jgi:hypothetical protein
MLPLTVCCIYAATGIWARLAGADYAEESSFSLDADQQPLAASHFDSHFGSCGSELEAEHTRLLRRAERSAGKWNDRHPRWRLLEALDGFDRYRQIVGEEINRFEALYSHVSPEQKQVRLEAQVVNNCRCMITLHRSWSEQLDTARPLTRPEPYWISTEQ